MNKRRRLSFDTEQIFQPSHDSAEPVEVTATSLSSAGSTVAGDEPVSSVMNSPLQSLLLTDMGYFPGDPITNNDGSLLNTTNYNIHLPQPEATVSMGIPEQSIPSEAPANDFFAAWSDTTVPFTRSVLLYSSVTKALLIARGTLVLSNGIRISLTWVNRSLIMA